MYFSTELRKTISPRLEHKLNITSIEVIPLARPLDAEFLGGTYRVHNRNTIITRIHTDAGVIGEAFGGDEDQVQERIVALIRQHLAPLLIGEDVRDVERLWEKMFFAILTSEIAPCTYLT